MSLTQTQIEALAEHIEAAELNAKAIHKITDDYPHLTVAEAYAVQWAIRRRKEARGTRIVGLKTGLTSPAKMQQMGIETPIYGFLADYFEIPDGGEVDTSQLIHPRIEAEIAFVTRSPLKGPGCHVGTVLAATDFVMPALEIIDSRYENLRFDLVSVIADNASSARFVTGSRIADPRTLDLRNLGVVMEKNGRVVGVGAGAEVLSHPATAVALLADMLGERGEEIPAGSVILSGAITAAVAVEPGDSITLRVQDLGASTVRFA